MASHSGGTLVRQLKFAFASADCAIGLTDTQVTGQRSIVAREGLQLFMSLVFETIQTEGLAALSYLIGDDEDGVAAVFDPRADVDVYVEMARAKNVAITHIFETHIHADLVSGARELSSRVESAKIYLSHEGGAKYGFEHEKVKNGDRFTLGSVIITARHTPGHTPEHISYLLAEIDDRLSSTIGYERPFNPFLQFADVQAFTNFALSTAPPIPKYYPVMKKVNADG